MANARSLTADGDCVMMSDGNSSLGLTVAFKKAQGKKVIGFALCNGGWFRTRVSLFGLFQSMRDLIWFQSNPPLQYSVSVWEMPIDLGWGLEGSSSSVPLVEGLMDSV